MNTQKRARQWMLGGLVLLAPVLDLDRLAPDPLDEIDDNA